MKPLAALLVLSLSSASWAAGPKPAGAPSPRPASEALLAAACDSKGGLLLRAPDGAADEPESLFGPGESEEKAEGGDAPQAPAAAGKEKAGGNDKAEGNEKAAGDAPEEKSKVLHLKARGKDRKKAKKECREAFREYYGRHGDLRAAVAPEVGGEMSQADRERMLTVLARSSPLQPLKSMSAKAISDQKNLSRRLFDGGEAIELEDLPRALANAESTLDRRAADAAKQATLIGRIHLRDQERARQQLSGEPLSPDLRRDPEFRQAARSYTPPPSLPPRRFATREPVVTDPEPSVLKNLSLADVPEPSAIPTQGVSRGSILADMTAALSGLGVKVLGRTAWGAKFGHNADAHTPMRLTVHHSAGSPSHTDMNLLGQIGGWEKDHVGGGYGRMGYHWVINNLGTVVEGTGTELVGSHTRQNNTGNVGVCLAGNFDRQEPTDKMLASLVGVLAYVGARYNMDTGSEDFVRGHEHYVRKACPGNHVMNKLAHIRQKSVELVLAQKNGAPGSGAITVAAVVN
ncbi:MAG: peptidoglycan recognition family protein [Elusimicrobiota bacterium]|nr:peptidoglycan recognition family protein [Elusimicrobiota bacterium]